MGSQDPSQSGGGRLQEYNIVELDPIWREFL